MNTPKKLEAGEWHIPFGNQIDHKLLLETCNRLKIPILRWQDGEQVKVWIATARCARLSYMTFEGEIDYEKDIKLHNQLLQNYHMSPFEHCAKVMTSYEFETYVK